MKKITIALSALLLSAASYGQAWNLDKAHSRLGFSVTHMLVSDVDGMFKNVDATINSSKPDFSDAAVSMTAQINSINTENEGRDEHLKSADFFDGAKYPTLTFTSKSIKKVSDKKYKVTGDLTMHGVTKTVTMDMAVKGPAVNPMSKKNVVGVKVTGAIKRSDFKLAESTPSAMLSDEVVITSNGEFIQG